MSLKILPFRVGRKFLITILYAYLPVLETATRATTAKIPWNWALCQTTQITFAYIQKVKKFISVYKQRREKIEVVIFSIENDT